MVLTTPGHFQYSQERHIHAGQTFAGSVCCHRMTSWKYNLALAYVNCIRYIAWWMEYRAWGTFRYFAVLHLKSTDGVGRRCPFTLHRSLAPYISRSPVVIWCGRCTNRFLCSPLLEAVVHTNQSFVVMRSLGNTLVSLYIICTTSNMIHLMKRAVQAHSARLIWNSIFNKTLNVGGKGQCEVSMVQYFMQCVDRYCSSSLTVWGGWLLEVCALL